MFYIVRYNILQLDMSTISFEFTYPHVHISQMHFSLCFLSDVFEDDLIAKSSFTVDALDVEVDVTLVFMVKKMYFLQVKISKI